MDLKPVTVTMNIPCISEFVGIIRLAVSGIATRMNFTVDEIEDIKIAVSEACTNSVQYAYENGKDETITLTCNLFTNKLEIIISDTGKGFDTTSSASPNKNENDKQGLGLGLTFIRSLMDDATVESEVGKGTVVKMMKKTSEPVYL